MVKVLNIFITALLLSNSFVKTDFKDVKIAFYYTTNSSEYQLYGVESIEEITANKAFDSSKNTVLYIHGYRENLRSPSIMTIVKAFTIRKTHNILVLDWSAYANGNYVTYAVPNLIEIGRLMGRSIYLMAFYQAFDMESFHGHSLGGQLAGYIGSWIIVLSRNTMKLQRITALDPAAPMFYTNLAFLPTHLSYRDAKIVDVIHTEAGTLGAFEATGSVDFWPNGGNKQPGCSQFDGGVCSHARSWMYFAESVSSFDKKFYAVKCLNNKMFTSSMCDSVLPLNNMGIDASPKSYGNYYLETNSKEPFSRGIYGTVYTNFTDDLDRETHN